MSLVSPFLSVSDNVSFYIHSILVSSSRFLHGQILSMDQVLLRNSHEAMLFGIQILHLKSFNSVFILDFQSVFEYFTLNQKMTIYIRQNISLAKKQSQS